MGLISSQIRVAFLTLYRSDLEFRIQMLTQTRLQLSSSVNELVSVGTDLDPDSPEMKVLNSRQERLKMIDQKLDAELKRFQNQLQAVDTEIDSAQKFVDKNIKSTFSYAGGN